MKIRSLDRELRENFAFREAGQDRLDFCPSPGAEDGALPGADVDALEPSTVRLAWLWALVLWCGPECRRSRALVLTTLRQY